MFSGEVAHSNFIVFGLTRLGIEPAIYRTPWEHANRYTTDAVILFWCEYDAIYINKYNIKEKKRQTSPIHEIINC